MVIQVRPHDLYPFYRKATDGYVACLRNPDNAHLQAEAPVPLSEMVVRQGDVKVVFSPAHTSWRCSYGFMSKRNTLDDTSPSWTPPERCWRTI